MMMDNSFRSLMVVGENPATLLDIYSMDRKVEPYVKYRYADAKKLKDLALSSLSDLVSNADKFGLSKFQKDYFTERLKSTKATSDMEYFLNLTNGLDYDNEGNAITTENPDGKWKVCRAGGEFSTPFVTLNGINTYTAKKGDIEWEFVHMRKDRVRLFEKVWDFMKGGKQPETDDDKELVSKWEGNREYLDNFNDKDALIEHNCMYWNYAVLNKDGWFSIDDDGVTESEWITTFYDKYIHPLSDDTLLSIYEFSTN